MPMSFFSASCGMAAMALSDTCSRVSATCDCQTQSELKPSLGGHGTCVSAYRSPAMFCSTSKGWRLVPWIATGQLPQLRHFPLRETLLLEPSCKRLHALQDGTAERSRAPRTLNLNRDDRNEAIWMFQLMCLFVALISRNYRYLSQLLMRLASEKDWWTGSSRKAPGSVIVVQKTWKRPEPFWAPGATRSSPR